jgi:type II secretory pathway component PulF
MIKYKEFEVKTKEEYLEGSFDDLCEDMVYLGEYVNHLHNILNIRRKKIKQLKRLGKKVVKMVNTWAL